MTQTADPMAALNAANQETLRAIASGTASRRSHPYFGYYAVDIFDCPPFLLFTNNDCPIAEYILYQRRFEMGSLKLWCRLARNASAILDIGAHVGIYSLAAAALRPDLAIHAFEPNPHAYARLRVHKRVNAFDHIIEHATAVGHTGGKVQFAWDRRKDVISSGGKLGDFKELGDDVERTVVPLTTVDNLDLGAPGSRALIKIDVEGAEHLVFQGMQGYLQARPDIIVESFYETSCAAINDCVLPLGYQVYGVDEMTGALTPQPGLKARSRSDTSYNQLLTTRPLSS